ncbi:MAG: hypothetical protein Q4F18_12710 [Clostridia bacterium]|nr:hypothetical protein [Clostridia bacterium]
MTKIKIDAQYAETLDMFARMGLSRLSRENNALRENEKYDMAVFHSIYEKYERFLREELAVWELSPIEVRYLLNEIKLAKFERETEGDLPEEVAGIADEELNELCVYLKKKLESTEEEA